MHAHSDYKIEIKGTHEEKSILADMLYELFKDESFNKFEKEKLTESGILKERMKL